MQRLLILSAVLLATTLHAGEGTIRRARERVPDRYLIRLNVEARNAEAIAHALTAAFGGSVDKVFRYSNVGFSATLTEPQAQALSSHPHVAYIEEVAVVRLASDQSLPLDDSLWNLDRTDRKDENGGLDNHYYYCDTGSGVIAYVLDSGVRKDHREFEITGGGTRVLDGANMVPTENHVWSGEAADVGTAPCGPSGPFTINGGHGTAVASIIGGKTYGIAKGVSIVPVKIFDCSGYSQTDWAAWGVEWIMSDDNPWVVERPAVANMSWYFFTAGCTPPITDTRNTNARFLEDSITHLLGRRFDDGVCEDGYTPPDNYATWNGIPVVVAANNQNTTNSQTSPARMAFANQANYATCASVISVGGIDEFDRRWDCGNFNDCVTQSQACGLPVDEGSNFGPTVDVWAPAHEITSAHISSIVAQRPSSRSGTSFAAPIATGVLARIMHFSGQLTPSAAHALLTSNSAGDAAQTDIDGLTGTDWVVHRSGTATCP